MRVLGLIHDSVLYDLTLPQGPTHVCDLRHTRVKEVENQPIFSGRWYPEPAIRRGCVR